MRWVIVAIVGIASAGLLSVSMNFMFGSSFGRTVFESYAYGAAFGFADILKVAAPLLVAKSVGHGKWGAATLGTLIRAIFTLCSAVSAIGFASANRTFTVDARTGLEPKPVGKSGGRSVRVTAAPGSTCFR